MSDRNSRSSDDRAREFRELLLLFEREKRPRNRETAEGGGVASREEEVKIAEVEDDEVDWNRSIGGGIGVVLIDADVDGIGEVVVEVAGVDFGISTLSRGDPVDVLVRAEETLLGDDDRSDLTSIGTGVAATAGFRPRNDNKPPLDFLLLSITGDVSSSLSITRHPGGEKSSLTASGLAFTEASHAVDPFDATYSAMGLLRVMGRFRVSRKASIVFFETNVCVNETLGGRVRS